MQKKLWLVEFCQEWRDDGQFRTTTYAYLILAKSEDSAKAKAEFCQQKSLGDFWGCEFKRAEIGAVRLASIEDITQWMERTEWFGEDTGEDYDSVVGSQVRYLVLGQKT